MEQILCVNEKENRLIIENLLNKIGERQFLSRGDDYYTVMHQQTNQITYVVNGKGKIILNNKQYEAFEGLFVIIPKGVTHSFIVESNNMELLHFHTPNEYIESDIVVIAEGRHG